MRDGERDVVELTTAELDARARAVAARLQLELGGAAAGRRALLCFPSGLEFPIAFLGCMYAGVVAVPISPLRPERRRTNAASERAAGVARDADAEIVLTTAALLAQRDELTETAPDLRRLRWIAVDALEPSLAARWVEHRPEPHELALLQYTSGSTGVPRGVMVSYDNLRDNCAVFARALLHDEQSVIVSWLPFHHDMGLIGMVLQAIYAGIPCVLMSPPHFLARPARWLEAVTRYRATTTGGPNFAYQLCVDRIPPEERARLDLSPLKRMFNGAEPVRHDTLERFAAEFAPCGLRRAAIFPGYGLAEATLAVSAGDLDHAGPVHVEVEREALRGGRVAIAAQPSAHTQTLVSCGVAQPGHEIAIVDPMTCARRADGELGEVWVRGPSVAQGYWRREDDTRRTFRAHIVVDGADGPGPFLRTGDLGFLHGGELYLTGRIKDLIILHGENHYPQDIERCAEAAHAALRASGAAAFALDVDGEEKVGLVVEATRPRVADADGVLEAVRRAVADEREVQVAALALIPPGALPKTSSGKVQRARTRDLWLAGELDVIAEWRAPRVHLLATATAAPAERTPQALLAWLAALAARGTHTDGNAADATLPALGLDSLRTIELAHAVERAFGLALPPSRWFAGRTLRELADELAESCAAARPSEASRAGHVDAGALSYGQRALWFLQRFAPDSSAYHVAAAFRVRSSLDDAAWERALRALSQRHESLRTTFVAEGGDAPRRIVHARLSIESTRLDASGLGDDELRREIERWARRRFDLERGPLVRTLRAARANGGVLALAAHHLVLDHWSLAVLLRDLGALYAAELGRESSLEPVRATYDDHVRAEARAATGASAERAWSYWSEKLSGSVPAAELLPDRPRPAVRAERGATLRTVLDADLARRVASFARAHGATPFVVCLAAFEIVLQRATGEPRFLIGTLSAGRVRADLAEVVGYCVNPLVVAADLTRNPTFAGLVERARGEIASAFEHDSLPFALLVERLRPTRDASRTPFFQVLFAWQHAHAQGGAEVALGFPGARVDVGCVELESLELDLASAQFDASFSVAESQGGLLVALEYDTDLFDASTAERWIRRFRHALESALAEPDARLSDLPACDAAERAEVLALQPGPAFDVGGPALGGFEPVVRAFEARVARDPNAIAIQCADRAIQYGDLDARAERLAARLREVGAGVESIVAVLAPRSVEMCVAVLGALKAGAAWLPIDPVNPPARRRFLVDDSGACVLLVHHALVGEAPEHATTLVLDERDALALEARAAARKAADVPSEAAACVFYTSGSTGKPKGVVIPQRALAAHARIAAEILDLGHEDRVLHAASIGFDLALEELFPAWTRGARVVVWPERAPPSIAELTDLIHGAEITVVDLPTAYWHEWARLLKPDDTIPRCLRLVVVGGERASAAALEAWRRVAPRSPRWSNSYGPTEATVTATHWELSPRGFDGASIPIGRPVRGYRTAVVEGNGDPAPIGVPGELAIGGVGLARGYVGNARATAARFVPDPEAPQPGARRYLSGDRARWRADGALEFLGRFDDQTKIRGFRVEPGEVESELERDPRVAEAAVVVRERHGAAELAAYVAAQPGRELDARAVHDDLRARLPAHLVPASITALARLPRTASGKIDRGALPAPAPVAASAARGGAPREGTETLLAELWQTLLGVREVGRDDGFFELGGDSIQSIQLAARAAAAGIEIAPQDVFRHPTLAELARAARTPRAQRAKSAGAASGPVPLTWVQRWFFDLDPPHPSHWNQSLFVETTMDVGGAKLERALRALVRAHDALRLRFARAGGHWSARVAAPGDTVELAFASVDVSSVPEGEREAAIAAYVARLQASFDLERGPTFAACRIHLGGERGVRLFLSAHHLAVDAVSWRILIDDLERALDAGGAVEVPPPPTSWLAWARASASGAHPAPSSVDAVRAALEPRAVDLVPRPYAATETDSVPLPHDFADGSNRVADERTATFALTGAETESLRGAARAARASVEELLVAALARTLAELAETTSVRIDVEGHGRALREPDFDLSRTVGWFTTLAAVSIDVPRDAAPAAALRAAKEALRRVARADAHGAAATARGDVLFNFLGELDGAWGSSGRFRALPQRPPADCAPDAPRSHVFEINVRVHEGRLRVEWSYSAALHRDETTERLGAELLRHLRAFSAPQSTSEALSPADFPLAKLSASGLGAVLAQIDPSQKRDR